MLIKLILRDHYDKGIDSCTIQGAGPLRGQTKIKINRVKLGEISNTSSLPKLHCLELNGLDF